MTTTPQSMSDDELPLPAAGYGQGTNIPLEIGQPLFTADQLHAVRAQAFHDGQVACRATAEQAGNYGHAAGCTSASADHPYSMVLSCCLGAEQAGKVEGVPVLKPDDGNGDDDAYNRGWNACRDFVLAKPTQPAATQQPVATVHSSDTPGHFAIITPALPHGTKLYAAPVSPSQEVEALAIVDECAARFRRYEAEASKRHSRVNAKTAFRWAAEEIEELRRALAPVQEKAP